MIYEFKPRQDLHGYAKPWPAGGGKNLHKPFVFQTTQSGVKFAYAADGSITLDGTATGTSAQPTVAYAVSNSFVYDLPAGTYTPSLGGDAANIIMEIYNTSTSTRISSGDSFTLEEETTILFRVGVTSGKVYKNQKAYLQIESGSSATAYEPYENICPVLGYDITGIGTIYGGALDSNSGKVLVKYDDADLGALTWVYNSEYGFYSNAWAAAAGAKVPAGSTAAEAYCSELQVLAATVVASKANRNGIGIAASLMANDDRFTVAADFKAAMDGVKFVYELATPVELTLTQEQINELLAQMGTARNFGSRTNMLNTWMKLAQGHPVSDEEMHMLRPSMRLPDDVVLRPTFEDTPLPEPDPVPDVVDPPAAEPEENITESEES